MLAVVGGGPAGLRAAEVLAQAGHPVTVFDAKPSFGRKFLVAGRGGLNLTHSESLDAFVTRYGDVEAARWRDLLADFGPERLRQWAAELGVETYIGTSGRVFPRGQQAAPLLRRWLERLRRLGVVFAVNQRLTAIKGTRLSFHHCRTGEITACEAGAAVLALGGASWPNTGSDGAWPQNLGLPAHPWQPANCGWEVSWRPEFLAAAEGLPIKNIVLSANGRSVAGEALITRYGLEGGAIYQLGPALRAMAQPKIEIDLKPAFSESELRRREKGAWRLSPAATFLLDFHGPPGTDAARAVKQFPVHLRGPRPIAEAISSAGGVPWSELNPDLMLRSHPGVFVAGEMIDWEAPTGGYLLQGCFSTGQRAGEGALRFVSGG